VPGDAGTPKTHQTKAAEAGHEPRARKSARASVTPVEDERSKELPPEISSFVQALMHARFAIARDIFVFVHRRL
jgi:hypothetical protein